MTRMLSSVFLLLFSVSSYSQEMVKVNIIDLYDKVPAPPADVKAAVARAECTGEGEMLNCNTKKFFQPAEQKLDEITQRISKVSMQLAQPTADAMKKIDPEQVKKKLATMSQAEQVAYAMEMSKQMGLTKALVPETEAVKAALEEYQNLNQQAAADVQNFMEISKKKAALREQRDKKHDDIQKWEETEAKKIPLVSGGEAGSFPDPKLSHALRVKALEKHIAVENEFLKALAVQWKDQIKSDKARYSPYQQKLAAVHYGEDAKNNETKTSLLNGQSLLLGPVIELVSVSKEATDSAVNWWRQKMAVDAQKPE